MKRSHVVVNEGKPQPITEFLCGKTVQRVLATRQQLLLRCSDGCELRISWRNDEGRMQGTPYLDEVRRWK